MSAALDQVLQLVAQGRLTAEEAAPILDALAARDKAAGSAGRATGAATSAGAGTGADGDAAGDRPAPRVARIEVKEHGRRVVDLRIPVSLGRFALDRVPGLSQGHAAELQQAIAAGATGPILDIQDADGDGVRIVLE